ncbi:required for excision 1-B domain-containing protein isoform X1 [Elgaria multicarinata webbii]|uniref:required for excision 1-B domain-containing protein isoform X1 n=1 Tax=Elgaria multicarinata webbii TaxID=159646 RepID=UPI002FCD5F74
MLEEDAQVLIRRFYALQSERVEAYHLFEEGHRAYLRSGPDYDFVRYRQLVHEITLAFSGISREILQIKEKLEGSHQRPDLAQHLGHIQEKEKEKLELANSNHRGNQRNSPGFQVRFGRERLTGRPTGHVWGKMWGELTRSPPARSGSPLPTSHPSFRADLRRGCLAHRPDATARGCAGCRLAARPTLRQPGLALSNSSKDVSSRSLDSHCLVLWVEGW